MDGSCAPEKATLSSKMKYGTPVILYLCLTVSVAVMAPWVAAITG